MIQQITLVLLIPKELWNGQRDWKVCPRKESSVHTLCLSLVGSRRRHWVPLCIGRSVGRYKPPTGFCHKPYEVTVEPQSRAYHSFRQAHRRVSKVQQKMCLLGEQRTRAPSILTLSWRSRMSPQDERLLMNHAKMPGFLATGGEEFNPGPKKRLDRSELLCNTVY